MSISDICSTGVFYSVRQAVLCCDHHKDRWKKIMLVIEIHADSNHVQLVFNVCISLSGGSKLQRKC